MPIVAHNTRSSTQRSLRRLCAHTVEPLEDRRMLSGHTGGTSDGGPPFSPIRVQNSRPGATVTIYLDFDGEAPFYWDVAGHYPVHGPGGDRDPVPGFSLDSNFNSFTPAELDGIDAIWAQVSEKHSLFNINVTTVRPATFNDAEAVHMIVGGSDRDWYRPAIRAGGVAPFEGFTRAEAPNEGFAFSADSLIPSAHNTLDQRNRHFIAETLADEAGHLFDSNIRVSSQGTRSTSFTQIEMRPPRQSWAVQASTARSAASGSMCRPASPPTATQCPMACRMTWPS